MRGMNLVNLLGGGQGADRFFALATLPRARTLRVLASLSMVGLLTITAGRANGQVVVGEAGAEENDPTIETLPYCPSHLIPTNSPFAGNYALGSLGLPQLSALPIGGSWANGTPNWHKDRRPAVVIQLASSGYTLNTRGAADWWWIDLDNNPSTLDADIPVDIMMMNPDVTSDDDLLPTPDNQGNEIPDQFETLIHRILYHKHHGFRRIILHLPAGSLGVREAVLIGPPGQPPQYMSYDGTNQSINQFNGMPAWKRNVFTDPDGPWHAFLNEHATQNPDTETDPTKLSIEVYIGGALASPEWGHIGTQGTSIAPGMPASTNIPHLLVACVGFTPPPSNQPIFRDYWTQPYTPSGFPNGGLTFAFDPREPSHMDLMSMVAMPWPSKAGIKSIWFDTISENRASQPYRWGYLEFSHHPYIRANGIRIGGETIPTTDNNGNIPDDCAIANMKWLANSQVVMPRATPTSPRAFRPLFKFSPRQNSEVHLVDNENGLAWDEWEEARERGFVVSMYAGKGIRQIELTKRWYSMANIRVADFNGDGLVTMLDRDMALAAIDHAIANPEAIDIIVYATGDINNDNFIDEDDRLYFNDVFFNHPELIENYGEARNL